MSRVGNKPISLPKGVAVSVVENGKREIQVKGPKGSLVVPLPSGVKVDNADGTLRVKRQDDSFRALQGLTRALTNNAILGVSTGFTRELDIVGTGFRAEVKGNILIFNLGYSHPIEVYIPAGIEAKVDKQTHIVLSGYDKQAVGQLAANIRMLRKPDPYKNKGVRYTGEVLRKKAGKAQGK
jgi:large subunit ribosomal protein L6